MTAFPCNSQALPGHFPFSPATRISSTLTSGPRPSATRELPRIEKPRSSLKFPSRRDIHHYPPILSFHTPSINSSWPLPFYLPPKNCPLWICSQIPSALALYLSEPFPACDIFAALTHLGDRCVRSLRAADYHHALSPSSGRISNRFGERLFWLCSLSPQILCPANLV